MRIVEINGTNYASTGKIVLGIAKQAKLQGFEVFTCCKKSRKSKEFKYDNQIYIGTRLERIISEYLGTYTGYKDYFNYFGTKRFINRLKQIKPDLIHLHIMHDTYINLNMFFKYLKESNIPVVWTFHDCWAFTGKCPHFQMTKCENWKIDCSNCIHAKTEYPQSKIIRSNYLWNKKKEWFTSINNLTIITPSNWLLDLVKQSYFKDKAIKKINNGIDLNVFKYEESAFRKQFNIEDKYIVLGVGYGWSKRKGLDTFIELSKRLGNKYQIVIVGTNDEIDKSLPNNIISIHRTYNQEELAKIYSAADIFVNPTLEDNLPTVNIEALACGTPVLTYNTGGSPEIIDETCGSVVAKGDIDNLEKEVIRICEGKPYSREACINRSRLFNADEKFNEYVNLFIEILNK